MRVAAALSTDPDAAASSEAAGRVAAELGGPADVAVVFISPHHRPNAEAVLTGVRDSLGPRSLVGCTGEWIVGGGREIEGEPAVSVWAASMPGAGLEAFHALLHRTPDGTGVAGMPDLRGRDDVRAVVLLADPYSFPADALLQWATRYVPGVPFVGGLASGGTAPGQHRLFSGRDVHDTGAVGLIVSGDVDVRTIVSQGCRPIGRSYVITRAEENVIHELAGQPAMRRLQEAVEKADPADRALATQGVLIGVVVDEYKEEFGRGDFVIRNVIGGDAETGAIAIGDRIEIGRTVQFQVRDADSADEDLAQLLEGLPGSHAGALLFTCNGRGSRLFAQPDHDVRAIHARLPELPVAGFFCNGEIGPIGGRNFLHGFTASAAFFG